MQLLILTLTFWGISNDMKIVNQPVVGGANIGYAEELRWLDDADEVKVYTGIGFKPKAIICFAIVQNQNILSMGFAESASNQKCIYRTTLLNEWFLDTDVMYLVDENNDGQYGTLVSFDADGFTFAFSKIAGADEAYNVIFLCIG